MANSRFIQHPGSGIPGALRPACPAVYPAARFVESARPAGIRPSVANLERTSFLKPVWNLQSDSTAKRLFTWQTDLTAFAPRQRWEEP